MGLAFSHGAAHWSYGGFHAFREALAHHEGIDLGRMDGFAEPSGARGGAVGTWSKPWDTVTTPLKPLLNHSDCDGHLTPEECAQVAPHLRELAPAVWPPDSDDWRAEHSRVNALLLADAMDACAAAGENLEFQ